MSVEVHVDGVIEVGRFAEFLDAAERWRRFREERNWCKPELLCGLSGAMNMVRLIFRYDSLNDFESEEAQATKDRDYAQIASTMPFQGSITYTIFRTDKPDETPDYGNG